MSDQCQHCGGEGLLDNIGLCPICGVCGHSVEVDRDGGKLCFGCGRMRYVARIDRKILSRNELDKMHWSKRHREREQWAVAIRFEGFGGRVPQADGPMKINILSNRSRKLDYDNLVGGCKPILDALKKLGAIVDDKPGMVDVTYSQQGASEIGTIIEMITDTIHGE